MKTEDKLYYCHYCQMPYDGEEDGDVGYGPPSRRPACTDRPGNLSEDRTND